MAKIPISTKPQLNLEMEQYTTETPAYGPTFTASMKQLLENDANIDSRIKPATTETLGRVKPDGKTTSVDENGVISVVTDSEMSDTSEASVQNKVVKKYVDDKQGKALTATLTTGETELVFTDPSITPDSTIDPYTSKYTVVATDMMVEVGKITMTFEAQDENVDVKVVIK